MKIQSLMKNGVSWLPIEVEVSLTKGLPMVEFSGLPDALARESVKRIKVAFENCDLPWPKTQRVHINLRPSSLKKSSLGLDLPIAIGLLNEMGVLTRESFESSSYFYGELDLEGGVHQPADLDSFVPVHPKVLLVTGIGERAVYCESLQIQSLSQLEEKALVPAHRALDLLKEPQWEADHTLSESMAESLILLAAGGHSALLAGPAGSGKTTLAQALLYLLRPPEEDLFRQIRKLQLQFGEEIFWKPLAAPHHSIPRMSFVGGNIPITPGEMTRAHGGILLMDEFLEFSPLVIESLREPMESGKVKITRRGMQKSLPADFQLVATTNLCPCGKYVPKSYINCRFSLRKCRSYLERLSGPILDRFDILNFSHQWGGEKVTRLKDVKERLKNIYDFQSQRPKLNGKMGIEETAKNLHKDVKVVGFHGDEGSFRRKRAVLRVARTFADIDFKTTIELKHLNQASEYAYSPFISLEALD